MFSSMVSFKKFEISGVDCENNSDIVVSLLVFHILGIEG